MTDPPTRAEQIERSLALRILRGDLPPGSTLPSVRSLAEQFDTTVPTIQRAVDRLGSTGLVSARRGSGIRVNDPRHYGDLSLLPLWFEALVAHPQRAAAMFADFLELRRMVAAHLVRTRYDRIVAALPQLLTAAATLHRVSTLEERARADAQLTRVVVEAADNFAINAVFRTVERLALEVPAAAEALYGDPESHNETIGAVADAIANTIGDPMAAADALDGALARWDRRTVQRFTHRLQRY